MLDPILTIIVFLATVLIGGYLTSDILRLSRLGYGTTLFFAAWLVLSLAYAMPFNWSAIVGDVTLMLLLSVLAAYKYWQRHKTNTLHSLPYDRNDYFFWFVFIAGFAAPTVILPVPLDTDAQGFGYLALTTRLNGDLTNLTPFNPELDYLYAPGLSITTAYLSERLGMPIHQVQFALSAAICLLFLICMYDFGLDIKDRIQAKAHMYASIIGTGLLTAFMDSHFTTLLGLLFGGTFLGMIYRYLRFSDQTETVESSDRNPQIRNIFAACLVLSALVLAHPDTTITIALGYGAWLLLMPLGKDRPRLKKWLTMTFLIPSIAFIGLLPWFISVLPLIGSEIHSPFKIMPFHWKIILSIPPHVMYHGGMIVILSIISCLLIRHRQQHILLAIGWLILIFEFSSFGILESSFPALLEPITKYHYAFNLAWHGPIMPYILLTGSLLAWLWRYSQKKSWPWSMWLTKVQPYFLGLVLISILFVSMNHGSVLAWSKGRLVFFGAFSSHDDVRAMTWIRNNTSEESVILNHRGRYEGDWVPVISERKSIYFRTQYFFSNHNQRTEAQHRLDAFWDAPSDEMFLQDLSEFDVDYILVPQAIYDHESIASHFRWQSPPGILSSEERHRLNRARHLKLIKDFNGARIYKVLYQTGE